MIKKQKEKDRRRGEKNQGIKRTLGGEESHESKPPKRDS